MALSFSRCAALYYHYSAPLEVYGELTPGHWTQDSCMPHIMQDITARQPRGVYGAPHRTALTH